MKIWIDLRFISEDLYSAFVIELVKWLIKQDKENIFTIYTNENLDWFISSNVKIKNVWIKNFTIKEQFNYFKILKKEKNNLMLFFNHYKPLFYVWNYYTLLPSLKDIFYNNFTSYFKKYSFLHLLEKNLQKSNKIICFDENTNKELIEKFNIEERKINCINWFFPNAEKLNKLEDLKINIRTKYDLKNKYFIYSGWEWVEKNYEKLVHVFQKIKKEGKEIDLVIMWETISRNIALRNLILDLNMQNNIHFISVIKPAEKILFYKNALWVIFPSFYEPFPFRLTEPLYFDTPIISSNIKNIKNIFWDKINYFSPISINSIYENIKIFIENEQSNVDYSEIKDNYKKEDTINELLEIIK